jgi:hypothetical protein
VVILVQSLTSLQGQLVADASLGTPFGINFVLTILGKTFVQAGLFDTPAFEAQMSAGFSYATGSNGSSGLSCVSPDPDNVPNCKGIGYRAGLTNSIDFKGDGFDTINLFKFNITNPTTGCISVTLPKGCSAKRDSGTMFSKLFSPETRSIGAGPAGLTKERSAGPDLERVRRSISFANRQELRRVAHERRQSGSNDTSDLPVATAIIQDTTGQYQMYPHWNGNIVVGPANATNMTMITANSHFMSINSNGSNIIWGDVNERVLHYFPATMTKIGVSRMRLAGWMDLPKGSLALTLAPVKDSKSGVTMLVAIDARGAHFWMYTCSVVDQGNKVFLVNDNTAGPKTLMQKNSQWIVTGGLATNCVPIAMHNTAA